MLNMKKHVIAAAVLCSLAALPAVAQQSKDGPWMVRARLVQLDSANSDNTGLGLTVNNKLIADLDITYFLNRNIAVELLLTVAQKHNVYSNGTTIGSLKQLPPTVTVQYHFDGYAVKPYVGAGINYTQFSSVNILGGNVTLDSNSWGGALQAGVDIPLSGNMYLNVDLKKIQIGTDVFAGGVKAGTFKVDPLLLGVGVGWRF
jgi:outer membrane protein